MVSKFIKNASLKYFHTIDQILRYLARSQDSNIIFGWEKKLKLVKYLDSDWAKDHTDQKSTSGFVFMLSRGPVSYAFKKQAIFTLSLTETKYVAISLAAQEAI